MQFVPRRLAIDADLAFPEELLFPPASQVLQPLRQWIAIQRPVNRVLMDFAGHENGGRFLFGADMAKPLARRAVGY
jgi:hypothetical protein